jgi:CheY-like chemotaxis protein
LPGDIVAVHLGHMGPEHSNVPAKVLMLDDEEFLMNIYKSYFEKSGYEVTTYHDADDALKALRAGYDPDVLLFDINMPDSRSGYEFIETVNHDKLGGHALKVALTNVGEDGALERIAELGTDAHFLKAKFLPSELVTKVDEMLKGRQKVLS